MSYVYCPHRKGIPRINTLICAGCSKKCDNRGAEMKITEIKRTVSFGQFENISMTATLDKGEDPAKALLDLEAVIAHEIEKRHAIEYAKSLVSRKEFLEQDIAILEGRIGEIQTALSAFNDFFYSDLPF